MMDPSITGIIAGVVHHFLIQSPNQAKLFTTFYAIAVMNTAFVILALGSKDPIRTIHLLQLLKDFAIFELFYVGARQAKFELTVCFRGLLR